MARLSTMLRRFFSSSSLFTSASGPEAPRRIKLESVASTTTRNHVTLRAHNLLRSFGSGAMQTYALQNVSLELRQGEMNLLMGPSGSGKSTLLAVISALLRPDRGQVTALGHNLWQLNDTQLEQFRLHHCSYIFQGYNLFPALTAAQQLEIVLRWGENVTAHEARKRALYTLSQLGLAKKTHMRPAQLSGGEKQRVAIGRALVKNPSFLFADEPTSALDWENGQQVIELLNNVARNKRATVLVVTHDPRLVPFADRVFEMADGILLPPGVSSHGPNAKVLHQQLNIERSPQQSLRTGSARVHLREPNIPCD